MSEKLIYKSSVQMMTPEVKLEPVICPWKTMNIGTSFSVDHEEMTREQLEYLARMESAIQKKKFRVIDHGPTVGYEVGRLE